MDAKEIIRQLKEPSRPVRIAPFVFGLLCFLLPFVAVSCERKTVAGFSGVDLVMGTEVRNQMTGQLDPVPPEPYAIATLVCVIVALVGSAAANRPSIIIAAVASGVGILCLILMKVNMDSSLAEQTRMAPVVIEMSYRIGYWLEMLALLVGLILSGWSIPKKSP